MIEWITSWAQGIIIAVIIATIIEMIVPNGNCKKYIKVVIGVYILFSIISPVISKITGKNFNLSEEFNLDKFYEEADSKSIYNDLNSNNSSNILDIYITNLRSDITAKLKNKGYEVTTCEIEIKDEETYEIKSLELSLKKISENNSNEEKKSSSESNKVEKIEEVNEINIKIGESNNKTQNSESVNNEVNNSGNKGYKSDLTTYEKNQVKEYLETTYAINKNNISID